MQRLSMRNRYSQRLAHAATLWLLVAAPALPLGTARADGCYTCGGGSSDTCKEYCRYSGSDTFEQRKGCEKKGCRVISAAACPAGGAKICLLPTERRRDPATVAIAWCVLPGAPNAS